MAEYIVNTDRLRNNADRIAQLQKELDSVAVRLGAMQLGSVLQVKASTALIAAVGDCKWAAAHQSDDLGRLARGLEEVAELYDKNENNLKEPKTQEQAEAAQEVENGNPLVDIADVLDELSWLGDIIGAAVGEVEKVAGVVVSAIQRFIQNFSEFDGDITDPRFWAEVVVETGVEIVKGAVIAAGVVLAAKAIAVAAGVTLTGAAVTVIGAAGTVVVGWVIDGIYELITGKEGGVTEAISDAIVDTGEKIVEAGKKAVDKAADVVEDTVEKVTDGVKTTWNNFVNAFS